MIRLERTGVVLYVMRNDNMKNRKGKIKCDTKDCDNWSNHISWIKGKRINRCCKCHVKAGNAPADWHSKCIETYKQINRG